MLDLGWEVLCCAMCPSLKTCEGCLHLLTENKLIRMNISRYSALYYRLLYLIQMLFSRVLCPVEDWYDIILVYTFYESNMDVVRYLTMGI